MVARHDKYYFEDGNVVFQVGEKLYRIHKRMLVGGASSVFTSMFSLPQHQDTEGQTDEKPIVLEREDPEQFEALMRILYPSLLENILNIPITTYTQAMRIAAKYSMDDVQVAITKVVQIPPQQPHPGLRIAILRLAFVAEFPSYFSKFFAIQTFRNASAIQYRPAADDIKPLIAHPSFLVLMMQYREGLGNLNAAPWTKTVNWEIVSTDDKWWLDEQFSSLGFKA